jgi:hypothetical protein
VSSQLPTPERPNPSSPSSKPGFFTRKVMFWLGTTIGGLLGVGLTSGFGYLYLMMSQDSLNVRNGQVSFSKATTTSTSTTAVTETPTINTQGTGNNSAQSGGIANSGDGAQIAGQAKDSFNTTKQETKPSIVGNNNTITIVSELPGFDKKAYLSEVNDLQPDSLVKSSSDERKIEFEKKEIIILGKPYMSFFNIGYYSKESRYVFKLDGTQKAVLLQFGLPDLPTGSTSKGTFLVKIYADGQPLWAGECRRSQGNQIISVPLEIPGKSTLTIEATSNGENETHLFFTKASLLKS